MGRGGVFLCFVVALKAYFAIYVNALFYSHFVVKSIMDDGIFRDEKGGRK